METKIVQMTDTIENIKRSNDLILNRLLTNEFETSTCSCECHKNSHNTGPGVSDLKSEIHLLEQNINKQEQSINDLVQKNVHLEEICSELKLQITTLSQNGTNVQTEERVEGNAIKTGGNNLSNTTSSNGDMVNTSQRSGTRSRMPSSVQTYPTNITPRKPESSPRTVNSQHSTQTLPHNSVQTQTLKPTQASQLNAKQTTPLNSEQTKPINLEQTTPLNLEQTTRLSKVQLLPPNPEQTTPLNKVQLSTPNPEQTTTVPDDGDRLAVVPRSDSAMSTLAPNVGIVDQGEKKYLSSVNVWTMMAACEQEEGKLAGLEDVGGLHTVICLDVSASMMQDDAWTQAKRFTMNFVEGIEEMRKERGFEDQHIALVTFGHTTKVIQRLTNEFDKLRNTIDELKIGGPSPMFGGIYMSIGAAVSSKHIMCDVRSFIAKTRIVVVTDGTPTDTCLVRGPDEVTGDEEITRTHIQRLVISNNKFAFHFVKVGNSDMNIIDGLRTVENWHYEEGHRAAYSLFYIVCCAEFQRLVRLLTPNPHDRHQRDFEDYSKEQQMLSLPASPEQQEDGDQQSDTTLVPYRPNSETYKRNPTEVYEEKYKGDFPAVGTRVRRGPDWRWRDEDGCGPGTVIGHNELGGQMWVEWDSNKYINAYNYNKNSGEFDLLITDDPRVVSEGDMAVGCKVKIGKQWRPSTSRISRYETGVVVRVVRARDNRFQVRWNNGVRQDCTHDSTNGVFEIEL